jgi:hypothetical protein
MSCDGPAILPARRALWGVGLVVLLAPCLAVRPADAQRGRPSAIGCRGERIAIITVLTLRPNELERLSATGTGAALARRVWVQTQPEVVRGFLQFTEGDVCTELARTESERVLRAQPFIAEASIQVIPLGGDSIGLAVQTQDEFPLEGDLRFREMTVSRIGLGTQNFDGTGIGLSAHWRHGFAYRHGIGGAVTNALTFNRPWVSTLSGMREPLGSAWEASIRAPFYTDLQKDTWFVGARSDHTFVPFRRPGQEPVLVDTDRLQWLVGLAHRIGTPRRSGLGGAFFEGESVNSAGTAIVALESGPVAIDPEPLRDRFPNYTSVRGGLTAGLRFLDFVPVRGMDALSGPQDVGRGVQLSLRASRSLWSDGGLDRDALVGTTLYAGTATDRDLLGLQVEAEARRPRGAPWDGIIGSGRAAWYRRPRDGRLHAMSLEVSGGWRTRVPYQVSAADRIGGVRGYSDANVGGARRAVLRLEERWRIPGGRGRADAAIAAFTDVGRVWAGSAAFGVTTPILVGPGVSLLLAAPVGASRTLRIDVAFPAVRIAGTRGVDFRVSYRDVTRAFWTEPLEVTRGRQNSLRRTVFND